MNQSRTAHKAFRGHLTSSMPDHTTFRPLLLIAVLLALPVSWARAVQYELIEIVKSGDVFAIQDGTNVVERTVVRLLGAPRINNNARVAWLAEFDSDNGLTQQAVQVADVLAEEGVEILPPIAVTMGRTPENLPIAGFNQNLSINSDGDVAYHVFLYGDFISEGIYLAEPLDALSYTNRTVALQYHPWPNEQGVLGVFDAPWVNDPSEEEGSEPGVAFMAENVESEFGSLDQGLFINLVRPDPDPSLFEPSVNRLVFTDQDQLPGTSNLVEAVGLPRLDNAGRMGVTIRGTVSDFLFRFPDVDDPAPEIVLQTGDPMPMTDGNTNVVDRISVYSGMSLSGEHQSTWVTGTDTNLFFNAIATPAQAAAWVPGPAGGGNIYAGLQAISETNESGDLNYIGVTYNPLVPEAEQRLSVGVFYNGEVVAKDFEPTPEDETELFYDFDWATVNDLGWVTFHAYTTNTVHQALGEAVYVAIPLPEPGIELVKTVQGVEDGEIAFIPGGGYEVTYEYTLSNTGEVHLASIQLIDDAGTPADSSDDPVFSELFPTGEPPMAPGASTTLTWQVSVTNSITNRAAVVANPVFANGSDWRGLDDVTDSDTAIVETTGLDLAVTAGNAPNGRIEFVVDQGDVDYRYEVTNVTTQAMTNIQVFDVPYGDAGAGDLLYTIAALDPGASDVRYFTRLVSATVTNVATAVFDPGGGEDLIRDQDQTIVFVGPAGLKLTKWIDGLDPGDEGYIDTPGLVTYRFRIENEGHLNLDGLRLYDVIEARGVFQELTPLPWRGVLAPGEAFEATFDLPVTETTRNLAIATGNPVDENLVDIPSLIDVEDTDTALVHLVNPGMGVTKRVLPGEIDEVTYINAPGPAEFEVVLENTGDVGLGAIQVVDDHGTPEDAQDDLLFTRDYLPVGERWELKYDYPVDADQTNRVEVTAQPYVSEQEAIDQLDPIVGEASAELRVVHATPNLTKAGAGFEVGEEAQFFQSNSEMSFILRVENPGDVALDGLEILDDAATPTDPDDDFLVYTATEPLMPGGSLVITSTIPMMPLGVYTNTATMTATVIFPTTGEPVPHIDPMEVSASASFHVRPEAGLKLVKTVGDAPDGRVEFLVSAGAPFVQVRYDYDLWNIGERDLADVVLTDDVYGLVGEVARLDSGERVHYTVVADISGTITNVAEAVGTVLDFEGEPDPIFGVTRAVDDAVVYLGPAGFELTKTAGQAQPGETWFIDGPGPVEYTYRVTNLGSITIDTIRVVDNKLGDIGMLRFLGEGATAELKATAVISNSVTNLAIAEGVPIIEQGVPYPGLIPVEDTDRAHVDLDPFAALELIKTAEDAPDGEEATVTLGRPFTYHYQVTNQGETWLKDVVLSDDKLGELGVIELLGPGATVLLETSIVSDVIGRIRNTATAVGSPAYRSGVLIDFLDPVEASDDASVFVSPAGMQLVKTAGGAPDGAVEYLPGPMQVVYSYRMTNIGQTHLRLESLVDDQFGELDVEGILAPGETRVVVTSQRITETITNHAVARALAVDDQDEPVADIPLVLARDSATVVVNARPRVRLTKTVHGFAENSVAVVDAGEEIHYLFKVDNVGDTPLVQLEVTDDVLGEVGRIEHLASGASLVMTSAVYKVTEPVVNLGTVTGYVGYPDGVRADELWPDPIIDTNDAVVEVNRGRLEVVKTAGGTPDGNPLLLEAPAEVTYRFVLRNVGETHLVNLVIEDDLLGPIATEPGPLGPGGELTFEMDHWVSQSETNIVTVAAQPANALGQPIPGLPTISETDDAVVLIGVDAQPGFELIKTVAGFEDGVVADVPIFQDVRYIFSLVNTGPTYLGGITVDDDHLGLVGEWELLAPGEIAELEFMTNLSHSVTNTATAVAEVIYNDGTPIEGFEPLVSVDDAIAVVSPASVRLIKTVAGVPDGDIAFFPAPRLLNYEFRIQNIGLTGLDEIYFTDVDLGYEQEFSGGLQPGEEIVFTLPAFVAADFTNLAGVSAVPDDPELDTVYSFDDASVDITPGPELSLVKLAGEVPDGEVLYAQAGSLVDFSIEVANLGETHLSGIEVVDEDFGTLWTELVLAPGESASVLTSVVITASMTGITSASGLPSYSDGTPITGLDPVVAADDAVVQLHPGNITLTKRAGNAADGEVEYRIGAGVVLYRYTIRNTGTTHLVDIEVTDDVLGEVGTLAGPLAPGEEWGVTLGAVVAGDVRNIATATAYASDSLGNQLDQLPQLQASDDALVDTSPQPELSVTKTADGQTPGQALQVMPDQEVSFQLVVRNSGETYLAQIQIEDPLLGWSEQVDLLPPGGQLPVLQTSVVVNATMTNVVEVTALPSYADGRLIAGWEPVVTNATAVVRVVDAGLSIVKTAGSAPDGQIEWSPPGRIVEYRYVLTNTGLRPLGDLLLVDDVLGVIDEVPGPMEPGAVLEWVRPALITRSVTNNVTVVGFALEDDGQPIAGLDPITGLDDAVVRTDAAPSMMLQKKAGRAPYGQPLVVERGTEVPFSIIIRNTGSTHLGQIRVEDTQLGFLDEGLVLAPGRVKTYVLREPVMETMTNVVEVTAYPSYSDGTPIPGFDPIAQQAEAYVHITPAAVRLTKTAGDAPDGQPEYGLGRLLIPFHFRVENTGSMPLVQVRVHDRFFGEVGSSQGPLAPGEVLDYAFSAFVFGSESFTNTATVVALPADPDGTPVADLEPVVSEDSAIVLNSAVPALGLIKLAEGAEDGMPLELTSPETVRYLYRVRNLGDTWLAAVKVTDDQLGQVGEIGLLGPGQEQELSASDFIAETTVNIGLAEALIAYGDGSPVPGQELLTASDDALVVVVSAELRIQLLEVTQLEPDEFGTPRVRVRLGWDEVGGVTAYRVERLDAAGESWGTVVSGLQTNAAEFEDGHDEEATAVFYRIVAER